MTSTSQPLVDKWVQKNPGIWANPDGAVIEMWQDSRSGVEYAIYMPESVRPFAWATTFDEAKERYAVADLLADMEGAR